MKKVLVVGGTGYAGKYAIQAFKNAGYWVRVLVRNPKKLEVTGPFLEPAVKDCVDEIFVGEVTKPETLTNVCDGIDIVYSSLGITRQRGKASFWDVDFQGNKNVLDLAVQAHVKQFVFVYVFNAHLLGDSVAARRAFVETLKCSGLDYRILCPTGYFSDLSEYLKMAQRGKIYVIGCGSYTINPIHGADLAQASVDSLTHAETEIPLGGPDLFTTNSIAELAFETLNKKSKVRHIPLWIMKILAWFVRLCSKHYGTLVTFFVKGSQLNFDAPKTGTRHLKDFYREFAAKKPN